ncbi:MAG: peroxiredoxin [Gammaproteobacteria bacterium]|nr:peroxiredoxin [Gammaproteobacteria bacterium]
MSVLVNKEAPQFIAPSVLGDGQIVDTFDFAKAIENKYALVFFYPLDFTFVCPSELIALEHKMNEFRARNIEVIAVSVDSQFTHFAWRNTPIEKGGIGEVSYTMVADVTHKICQDYGIQHSESSGVALRGAFLIDKKGIVRSQIVNDLPFGRNIEEILRLFDAIEFFEQHGEVCPANWKKGDKGMVASPDGVADYLAKESDKL